MVHARYQRVYPPGQLLQWELITTTRPHAGSGVNRVQVVLSGFSVRLFCFVQATTLCRYGCMCFLAALVLVYVDVMVMSSA